MKPLLAALLLLPTVALAQQPQPASPTEQALGAKLIQEFNAGLQCSANVVTLQQRIAELEKQLAEKSAPPPPPGG